MVSLLAAGTPPPTNLNIGRFQAKLGELIADNRVMDEKRELLMQLLFGNEDKPGLSNEVTQPDNSPEAAARFQKWAKAQQKAQTINETLENSEKSADILREMMNRD